MIIIWIEDLVIIIIEYVFLMTKNNYLTTILAITALATIVSVSAVNQADAAHNWFQPTWSSGTHDYDCEAGLDNLDTNYIDACDNLQDAADVWNDVSNSDWDLTEDASGEIPIDAENLATGVLATATTTGSPITSATIDFNTDYTFTDSTQDTTDFDYETVAIHEMGHLLHLVHEPFNSSSPMYYAIPEDTVKRTLASHDIDVIRDMY